MKGSYFDVAADKYVREEIRTQQEILRKRRELYTHAQRAIDAAGRVVIIVDDGIATGLSMLFAIRSVRARKPQKIVIAIGVATTTTLARLQDDADEVVCLYSTDAFLGVGEFFEDFSDVTYDMAVAALERVTKPLTAQQR